MRVMGRGPLWMTMCRGRGRSVGVNVKTCLGCRQNAHARPAVRAQLNCERSLKDLVGVLAGEVELVRDDYNGVAVFRREAAKGGQQIDLRADVQVQRGLIEKQEQRLLRER